MKMLQLSQLCQLCRNHSYTIQRNICHFKSQEHTMARPRLTLTVLPVCFGNMRCTFGIGVRTQDFRDTHPLCFSLTRSQTADSKSTTLVKNCDNSTILLHESPLSNSNCHFNSNKGNVECTSSSDLYENNQLLSTEHWNTSVSKRCWGSYLLKKRSNTHSEANSNFNDRQSDHISSRIGGYTCNVLEDTPKTKCNWKHITTSKRHLCNKTGIFSTSVSSNQTYLLQNRDVSQVKQTYLIHTSSRCHVLHEVDSDKTSNVSIKVEPPWKIMFFGTDDIALMTLKALYENMNTSSSLVESINVTTIPQKHAVYKFAKDKNLPIQTWPIKVEQDKYDVGILVSFGHLIPDRIIHMFPYGILNMHPSLLPRWRGASPIIHTILNGDVTTGVSIMEIRPKHFDIGPLLLQRQITVPRRCTSFQLLDILGNFGSNMVLECLKDLPRLEAFEHEQTTDGVTYAHKLRRSDCYIDWDRHTATQVDCQYRAIFELMPLKTLLSDQTVRLQYVVEPNLLNGITSQHIKGYNGNINKAKPGTVAYYTKQDCIVIKCKDGLIGFQNIVLKQAITAQDFYNGYLQKRKRTQFTSFDNSLNKFIRQERLPVGSKV